MSFVIVTRSGIVTRAGIVMPFVVIARCGVIMRSGLVMIAAMLLTGVSASAAELKALVATPMKAVIDTLAPPFERQNGIKMAVSYDTSGRLAQRIRKGETADVVLIASTELDKLIGERRVKDRTEVTHVGIAIAVKKGAPHPDVSTADALKRTLLAAKSIGQISIASDGLTALHVQRVFTRLGILEKVSTKLKFAKGGPKSQVGALLATEQAEIGLDQASELMANPDVDVIGMLPDRLQQVTVNAAGIVTKTREPEAARAFIRQLTTPEALALYKAKGLGL